MTDAPETHEPHDIDLDIDALPPALSPSMRQLMIRVDSVCSLVAHRYNRDIPLDVRQELIDVSTAARNLYELRHRS